MYCLIFISAILMASAVGENFFELSFSKDPKTLSDCIQDYLTADPFYSRLSHSSKEIADKAAEKLSGTTNAKTKLYQILMELQALVTQARRSDNYLIFFHKKFDLTSNLKKSIIHCSDDYDEETCKASNHRAHRKNLPNFSGEPHDFFTILNYILVDFEVPFSEMVETPEGRGLLESYAENALRELKCTLSQDDNHTTFFRVVIRALWARRAQKYYNANNTEMPYVSHCYTEEDRVPHTCGCSRKFVHSLNGSSNDFPAPQADVDRILAIHVADPEGQIDEHDFYSRYELNGMTSSESYMERHIDQFYRLLFYYLETRGSSSAEEESMRAILFNDTRYRDYLLGLRNDILRSGIDVENLGRFARVHEEALILALDRLGARNIIRGSTTTSTTVPPEFDGTKVGSSCYNMNEKHSLRRIDSYPGDCCDANKRHRVSRDLSKKSVESCLMWKYGYSVTDAGDFTYAVCSVMDKEMLSGKTIGINDKKYGYLVCEGDVTQLRYHKRELVYIESLFNWHTQMI